VSISISTDHFLLDGHGPTITASGYEISWLMNSVGSESSGGYEFYRELVIERLSDRRSWHWRKGLGRWTTLGNGEIVDGWIVG
jgi:hypothetical protein